MCKYHHLKPFTGAAHLDYCPAYDNIPIYLIVAGVFGVLKVLIYSVQVGHFLSFDF